MNHYFKLVNFELIRFIKIYLILIGITIISQLIGVVVVSRGYLKDVNQAIYQDGMSKATYLEQYGELSFFDIGISLWFFGPIALSIVTLLIYVFFIWYRDWFAKNTFIYRLLTLPTTRLNVYLAKASAIFLMVLGLSALQLVLFPIESRLMQWMVPVDFRRDLTVSGIIDELYFLNILFPESILQFILYYGVGFMVVFIIFTAILFERSFKWKGIILGILYGAVAITIYVLPGMIELFILPNYFYPAEKFVLDIIAAVVVSGISIWIGHVLLKNKVTV